MDGGRKAELAASLVADREFARATALAGSHGVISDPAEAEEALRLLHPPRQRMPRVSLPTTPANEAAKLVTAASLDK